MNRNNGMFCACVDAGVETAAQPAAVPDTTIGISCEGGWACCGDSSRRYFARVAVQVSRQPLGSQQLAPNSLVSHSWAMPAPDCVALLTDALVIFPWDKEVYADGR